jgi:putative AlgH/UPF0301 family transcriptional regulator
MSIFIGYSGWITGQLEEEIGTGSWHIFKTDVDTVFDLDTQGMWERFINRREPTGTLVRTNENPSPLVQSRTG